MDEIETLMPRTKAANDRAQVDRAKLKQYMVTKNTPHSVGARSGVVVRGDVRKDAEGFEDVDDFWVDDEDSMQDDSVDDDDSLTASDKEAADTSGDISEPSEHEVELPDIGSPSMSDRESMDIEAGPIPSRSVVRSLRNSGSVLREEKTAEAPPSPARSDVSFDFGGSPHGSVDMNDMNAEANVTMRDRRKKSTGNDTTKSKARRRESFGGFDDDMASPFSLNEGPVTPLSNASDRTLKSIPSYKSSLSPNISKELFKDGDYNSDVSAKKPKKKQAKGKAAKKKATSRKQSNGDAKTRRIRPTGKYGYRTNPPTTDTSIQSIQTDDDNDESFEAQNDSGGETGDDSFYNEPDAPTGPVRDRLPDASKILDGDEDDDAWDGSGLRRSKRRRFKPLAWFKSEHMVYERTFVGVGTVMPTVVGVERLGRDDSPTKRTKAKPPSKRTNNSRAFSLKDLPKDVQKRIVESEWATLFDSQAGCMNDLNIICRSSEIRLRKLPTEERGGAVVHAYAGQSFNLFSPSPFARWISGRVVLPPGAWKEPEGVGQAVQLFYVTGCQPKSLELALAPETDDDFFKSKHTTHFLLSPGDEFYVPSGNVYYVKNHSSTADCDLRFTILKPEAPAMVDDIDVEEKEEPTTEQPQDVEAENSPLKRKREDGAEADADRDSDSV